MTQKYAVVFPGQGSQSLNMLQPFSDYSSIVEEYCQRASDVLHYDIAECIAEGPEEKLNRTEFTQPALLLAGVVAWEIWKTVMPYAPLFLSGHSLGEYTALVCADSISFEDAVRLVQARGRFMQEAVPEGQGAMAAIVGLQDDKVLEICQSIGSEDILSPANFNSIGQVVIAGKRAAVEQAIFLAKTAGAKIATLLPMSVPSHCRLMFPAAEKLQIMLESIEIQAPRIPVMNNVDVLIESSPEKIKSALVRQLYSPVRWVEIVENMIAQGVLGVIECGPGKVLTGLIKRIDKNINGLTIAQRDEFLTLL